MHHHTKSVVLAVGADVGAHPPWTFGGPLALEVLRALGVDQYRAVVGADWDTGINDLCQPKHGASPYGAARTARLNRNPFGSFGARSPTSPGAGGGSSAAPNNTYKPATAEEWEEGTSAGFDPDGVEEGKSAARAIAYKELETSLKFIMEAKGTSAPKVHAHPYHPPNHHRATLRRVTGKYSPCHPQCHPPCHPQCHPQHHHLSPHARTPRMTLKIYYRLLKITVRPVGGTVSGKWCGEWHGTLGNPESNPAPSES